MTAMTAIDPNPLVMVTLEFQDGARLSWKLTKTVNQVDVFGEIGKLAGKYNLGIDFDIPEPAEGPNGS